MKRFAWLLIILVLAVAVFVVRHYWPAGDDTVEYRGEHFKMSKSYGSYEEYKDDTNNLASSELPRIEKVMLSANIGTNFSSRREFAHAVYELKFPGYGVTALGEKPQPDGSSLVMMSIEIPQRDKDRYLVARKTKERFAVIDDFVANSSSNAIAQVKLEGTKLVYLDRKGSPVREKQL
jgi:hypothetical protein